MNYLLLFVVLIILFGTGGYYFGGASIGGVSAGTILLVGIAIYLLGGFRNRS